MSIFNWRKDFIGSISYRGCLRLARLASLILTAHICTSAYAGSALLTWTAPTQNIDGSPLTDLASYRIYSGCSQSGLYERAPVPLGLFTSYTLNGLPDVGTCYFRVTALDTSGNESEYSNEASKFFGQLSPPDNPTLQPLISWVESPPVALAFGTHTNAAASTANPLTFSHTVAAGSDKILIVGATARSASGQPTPTVDSVTYNGVGMTEIDEQQHTAARIVSALYYIVNPPEGAHDVVVTYSSVTIEWVGADAFTLTGADQSSPIGVTNKGTATTADNISTSITTGTANSFIVGVVGSNTGTAPTASDNVIASYDPLPGVNVDFTGTQYQGSSAAGAHALAWTGGDAGQAWTAVIAEIKEVQAGGGDVNARLLGGDLMASNLFGRLVN